MKKSPGTPTFLGILSDLWDWVATKYNKVPGPLQVVLYIVYGVWTFLWLLVGVAGGEKGFKSPVAGTAWVVTSSYSLGKAVVCWPIRKAVECCVPGINIPSGAEGTKVFHLKPWSDCSDYSNKGRRIVTKKLVEHPVYTVSPYLEFDAYYPCGNRWHADRSMTIRIFPPEISFCLVVEGDTLYVTKETHDKVQIGDVVDLCGTYEAGAAPKDSKEILATFDVFREEISGEKRDKAFATMVKVFTDALNREDTGCASDKKAEQKIREDEE